MHTNPIAQQITCLQTLRQTRSLEAAIEASGLGHASFMAVLADAEQMYGRPLVAFHEVAELTEMGEIVLRCAPSVLGQPMSQANVLANAGLTSLLDRRSVSPKRLGAPGPDAEQIQLMLQAALAAPDHGSLHPWRVLEFKTDQREALAKLFENEKLRRDPLASSSDRHRAREHATRPPTLLAFIVSPRARSGVPEREQWLAAGAALGNLLNAAHDLGFGAIILSGERCHDEQLVHELGLLKGEVLAGFISMGQVVQAPPKRKPTPPDNVWSRWEAPTSHRSTSDEAMQCRRLER